MKRKVKNQETFSIHFEDLKPEIQAEYLAWAGLKDPSEANLDCMPLTELCQQEGE